MSGQRLLVADDHPLFAREVAACGSRAPARPCGRHRRKRRSCRKLAQQHRHYDLVLLDYHQLPDALGFSGFFASSTSWGQCRS